MNKEMIREREFGERCRKCGKLSKVNRMFDIDGVNLVERLFCLECGSGTPALL